MALYAFDGTMDDDRAMGTDAAAVAGETNVWKFYSAYKGYTPTLNNQYVPGVGTRLGPIGAVVGSTVGAGWLSRINDTYDVLCDNYVAGDKTIDVVGFSRGSALALDFVNKVARDGVKKGDTVVEPNPAIRFLSLFDVVAAFGVANLGFVFARVNPLHHFTLPKNVQNCFHAMALDERRPSFEVTRVERAYEVWFRGVHSDIGGGNGNPGLNNITLRWMYRKAILCGLPVTEANISDQACVPSTPIKPNVFSEISPVWRSIEAADLLHYTVGQHVVLATEDCNECPSGCPIETPEFERHRRSAPQAEIT